MAKNCEGQTAQQMQNFKFIEKVFPIISFQNTFSVGHDNKWFTKHFVNQFFHDYSIMWKVQLKSDFFCNYSAWMIVMEKGDPQVDALLFLFLDI